MSWDCSLIMRTYIDQQPVSIVGGRFVHHKKNIKNTTTNERPNSNNILNNHKRSLKLKCQQADKSKEIHKKKSLKNKNTQLQTKKGSIIVQQEFLRVMLSPTYSQNYKRNIRMQTQPCQTQFVRPISSAFQIIKFQKQNQTHESFIISKKKQIINKPNYSNFIITNHSPSYINPPITYQARKISAFCPTQRVHNQNLKYKNSQNTKQLEKIKPNINQNKSKQAQQIYSLKILPATISLKSFIQDRNEKNEKKQQKIDKQNIKNFENEVKLISNKLNFKQGSNISNKKIKIQDFLNQKQQIESVRDESELSEQQFSQIILSYGQLLKQRGKFELNSNYNLI